ncbi:MAG: hydrogenase maturation protease [Candidatus Cyclonatronum sp.]|uniref:hydrogenase maturation protease n=1 Tax=Cyclonatronum sp. TaxID=3024185 RepID=UPI0025BE72D1|nr:hydrogenase maturation protease [Cyclonatronum sp.]MCH8485318.1 hydrogenase maturation protease [Cyclonatronum sp.]
MKRTLLIGIGNASRGDDGLGWRVLDEIQPALPPEVETGHRFQLQVEDAALIAGFNEVIFADATETQLPNGARLSACEPAETYFFSSHLQSPEAVLYLCETLYGQRPKAYVLAITGRQWALGSGLSEEGEKNLKSALRLLRAHFGIKNKAVSRLPKPSSVNP